MTYYVAPTVTYLSQSEAPADSRRLERANSVLLVGFLLLTFVGTHPLQTGTVQDRADGSVLDRLAVFSLFGLAIAVMWMARGNVGRALVRNWAVVAVVGFCLASIVWSNFPALTLRRSVLLLLLTSISMAIAVGATDLRRVHTQLFVTLTCVVALNIVVTVTMPGLAISQLGVQGIYTQKNVAGIVALITLIVGSAWLVGAGRRRIFWALLALAMAFGFLVATRSKTSINLAVLGIMLVAFVAAAERFGAAFILLSGFFGAILLIAMLGWLALHDFDFNAALAAVVGDTSFSGREELWDFVLKDAQRHWWLGHGYGAYWDVGLAHDPLLRAEAGSWMASVDAGVINQAHHGYIELWLHIGYPMTVFATLTVAYAAIVGGLRALFGSGSRESRVFLGGLATLLIIYLLHNLTEASLFMRGEIFSNFAIFAMLLLSRAKDLGDPQIGRLK